MTKSHGGRSPVSIIVGVLRGYPFAFAVTLILGVLGGVAIVRKVRSLLHRWQDAHVSLVVKPGEYNQVLERVQETLAQADLPTEPRDAGMLLSGPPKLLDMIAGRSLGDLVPDRLILLLADDLEILVYPSDLAIMGTKLKVARARAALASRLIDAEAYMTISAESQVIEDELEQLRDQPVGRQLADGLSSVDGKLASLTVPFDEWQTLYRLRALAGVALIALDVTLLVGRRRSK